MNVDIRLMDQLGASIAECDTIFAGKSPCCPGLPRAGILLGACCSACRAWC